MTFVIGIAGPARVGKNTVADAIGDWLWEDTTHSYLMSPMAGPIKEALRELFGWTDEHLEGSLKEVVDERWGFSPRRAMQWMGTEWGREFLGPDTWIKRQARNIGTVDVIIIPDIRFDNEAEFVRKNGVVIHVKPGDRQLKSIETKIGESGIAIQEDDYILMNGGTLQDLESKLDELTDSLDADMVHSLGE